MASPSPPTNNLASALICLHAYFAAVTDQTQDLVWELVRCCARRDRDGVVRVAAEMGQHFSFGANVRPERTDEFTLSKIRRYYPEVIEHMTWDVPAKLFCVCQCLWGCGLAAIEAADFKPQPQFWPKHFTLRGNSCTYSVIAVREAVHRLFSCVNLTTADFVTLSTWLNRCPTDTPTEIARMMLKGARYYACPDLGNTQAHCKLNYNAIIITSVVEAHRTYTQWQRDQFYRIACHLIVDVSRRVSAFFERRPDVRRRICPVSDRVRRRFGLYASEYYVNDGGLLRQWTLRATYLALSNHWWCAKRWFDDMNYGGLPTDERVTTWHEGLTDVTLTVKLIHFTEPPSPTSDLEVEIRRLRESADSTFHQVKPHDVVVIGDHESTTDQPFGYDTQCYGLDYDEEHGHWAVDHVEDDDRPIDDYDYYLVTGPRGHAAVCYMYVKHYTPTADDEVMENGIIRTVPEDERQEYDTSGIV